MFSCCFGVVVSYRYFCLACVRWIYGSYSLCYEGLVLNFRFLVLGFGFRV